MKRSPKTDQGRAELGELKLWRSARRRSRVQRAVGSLEQIRADQQRIDDGHRIDADLDPAGPGTQPAKQGAERDAGERGERQR